MLPPLHSFQSYRDLLKSVLDEEKASFSTPNKNLALALEISPSNLSMIMDGKRNLTLGQLLKLGRLLKCSELDLLFLEALMLGENSKEASEKQFYLAKIKKMRDKSGVTGVRVAALPKISSWHILPLFVYITDFIKPKNIADILEHCKILAEKFEISEVQLQSEIELLETLEVLSFCQDQKVHLRFDKLTGELSQIKFMESLIGRALKSVATHFTRPDSHFSAEAITLNPSQSTEFYQRYKSLVSEFVTASDQATPDQKVMMISLQIIPANI